MPRTTDSTGTPVPQRLLAAATRLFAEQGYDRTSVQEIVEAAGVTKGALYHYFGSKDDLLHEVYARVLRVQQERLDTFAGADAPVEERLRGAAADVVVTTIENLDDAAIFFRSMHHLSPRRTSRSAPSGAATTNASAPSSRRARSRGSSPPRPRPTWSWTTTSGRCTTCRRGTAPRVRSVRSRSPTIWRTCCCGHCAPEGRCEGAVVRSGRPLARPSVPTGTA